MSFSALNKIDSNGEYLWETKKKKENPHYLFPYSSMQLSNYCSFEGVLYCKPHFDQLYKMTGSLQKSFEGEFLLLIELLLVNMHSTLFRSLPTSFLILFLYIYVGIPRTARAVRSADQVFPHPQYTKFSHFHVFS